MEIAVQYLEGGSLLGDLSPRVARNHLRLAFERVPFTMLLLGWDLPAELVEGCATECLLHRCDLYLWQPLLTTGASFPIDPAWQVVALNGRPARGHADQPAFTFFCPNQAAARAAALRHLQDAVASGFYRGVLLDRIRFPSPSADFAGQFGCFCDACRTGARKIGLDLSVVRQDILRLLADPASTRAAVKQMLSPSAADEADASLHSLDRMLAFRQSSITAFVAQAADLLHSRGLQVGLDCYSPTLARMVGQDLAALASHGDWLKTMTYLRALAPASIPFELLGLMRSLVASGIGSDAQALRFLAEVTGWPLPTSRAQVEQGGLPASILTEELRRGRAAVKNHLFAGIELVELPGVARLTPDQIRTDAAAVIAGKPDGVVLSWDLQHIPLDRLDLARRLYLH